MNIGVEPASERGIGNRRRKRRQVEHGEEGAAAAAAQGESTLEVELTLGGDTAALDRGWRAAVPAGGGERAQRLRSTYFDTGDFRLRRRGFTLRIREEGERLVQTLKSEQASDAGAVLRRNEWSRPVGARVPSLPVAPDPMVRDAVGPLGPAELAPAFSTDVMRRTATIEVDAADHGRALVELAYDSGEITARGRRDRVSELELELIEGPASALYELAMTLQASAPLRIQTASKAKRGYVLAGGEGYAGCKAPALALAPGISVDEALGEIFRACAAHCAANHDAVLDSSDPEGVHQFRVALRRLRSALAVFKAVLPPDDSAWLEGEASRLTGLLGPARDWDVFITETLAVVRAARPDDDTLRHLAAAAEAARSRAYEQAEALRAPGYTLFLLRFGRWIETGGWRNRGDRAVLDQPLACLAGRLLDRRHRRVLKRGRHFERLSDPRLHRLRLTLKKLRYAGEFFATQFPESRPRPYIKTLRRLQDDLGRLNDAAVAERRLQELLSAHRESAGLAALGVAAGQVIGWQTCTCEEARARMAEDWRAFTAARPYWRPHGDQAQV